MVRTNASHALDHRFVQFVHVHSILLELAPNAMPVNLFALENFLGTKQRELREADDPIRRRDVDAKVYVLNTEQQPVTPSSDAHGHEQLKRF